MAILTIAADINNDLYLPDGHNLRLDQGEAAVQQGLEQATKMVKGENPFNSDEGVDYFGHIFCPNPNYDMFRFDLTQAALSVPDVVSVQDITMTRTKSDLQVDEELRGVSSSKSDVLSYTMTVATVYGKATIEESV